MMGYSEESKAYQLFKLVKQHIILRRNVWFDEKSSSIKLLNSSSGLLQDDHFDVASESSYPVPFLSPSTGQSNYVPILVGSSTRKLTSKLI